MRKLAATILVLWVFLVGPTLCVAGVEIHACGCEEGRCSPCNSAPCEGSHGCHDDPCPADVCRPEQDELVLSERTIEGCRQTDSIVLDCLPAGPITSSLDAVPVGLPEDCPSTPLPTERADVILPLLI
jgi:hypothetical protein